MIKVISLVSCILCLTLYLDFPKLARAEEQKELAFPGAVGFGKATQGGRGGRIIFVTNLHDSGPGSLRACTSAIGNRNCVFRVGGIIELERSLEIGRNSGRLSVLGQTAPGDGILLTIRAKPGVFDLTPLVIKNTHDVLIRHIRVRPQISKDTPNVDAVTVENSSRVYIDHISGSWATDENFNAHSNTTDLTIAYSIFGEGLRRHSKCALLGSDPTRPQNITFWRNACVSNGDRNPDNNHYGNSCVEVINNVFYNAKSEWSEIFTQYPGGTPISYIENFFKAGPSTNDVTFAINWNPIASVSEPTIYQDGNRALAFDGKRLAIVAPDTLPHIVSTPPCQQSAPNTGSAEAAYKEVHRNAGAFPRDAVDSRFIHEMSDRAKRGSGAIVSVPGELPSLKSDRPYADADRDGMADDLEPLFGAKFGQNDAWIDGDGNGWSNFDDFMQWLSDERTEGR